ncbi:MAG: 23S rRNA (adenine(2503)-C(2))-methyltransferase RlmN [Defluviitaleaceae bacterium]|nr:23S rRNA (adenine(2503)-C(2))-methyltransferase RlmN [Defluviitaleaceae bacterium]
MTRDILSMNITELRSLMVELNQPAYRAEQIFEWLHRRGASQADSNGVRDFYVAPFARMDNLPKTLREILSQTCRITPCREVKKQVSKDGTVKYLFQMESLSDAGVFIESVLMEYEHGHTVCISTQAGCRMGCVFCASAVGGLARNLTAGEMCAQVYAAGRDTKRVSSVVLMGCGEPLDNFDAVMRFIELITHEKGANIGARHITLSTCGLVPKMRALAERKLQINLAVSLHGTTDEMRGSFMPIAKKYPINELIHACRYYIGLTNRRITFEYALTKGINDSLVQAKELADLLKGMLCHVNLIPINVTSTQFETKFSPTPRREAETFANVLIKNGIPSTIRRSLGCDIAAACGQLRSDFRM